MTNNIIVTPIGHVRCPRVDPIDDNWGDIESTIELDSAQFTNDVFDGLHDFSHLDVIYVFDQVDTAKLNLGSRHPRNREDWPQVGIFAQRAKARPNRLGVSTCELVEVGDLTVTVRGLDAIDATPVLDIKPHVREFGPRSPIRQPAWITELMASYW